MLRLFLFLAFLPSRALAFSWNATWKLYQIPSASLFGPGENLLNSLALDWFNFISKLIIGICIIAVVWGASTMQGVATDEANRENGKKIIVGALIGLVLAILAKAIVDFADVFISPTNFPVCGAGGGPGCP